MADEATSRMLICLWKGCDCVFNDAVAFQEHVTNHGQQLNWQNHDTKDEKQLAVKAKWNEDKDEKANLTEIDESKIVFLAIEVWTDVFGFIKRIQLARTVSLTNRHIHQICWPRLHGDKVRAHEVQPIIIGYRHELDQQAPTAHLLQDGKVMPIPSCPPPPYISGFGQITIKILDEQVLQFLRHILPCMAAHRIEIRLRINEPTQKQNALVDQMLEIFKEGAANIHLELDWNCRLASIQSLPNLDNKMQKFKFYKFHERDIPLLMQMLASPRPDGQQRVICMSYLNNQMLDAIKKEFFAATQPLPQPFCIRTRIPTENNNAERSEEENAQTDETLIIKKNGR